MTVENTLTAGEAAEAALEQGANTQAQAVENAEGEALSAEAEAQAAAEAAEKAKKDGAQKRIDKAVRAQREAERAAEAARQEADRLRAELEVAKDPEKARAMLEEAEINRRGEERAKQLFAQRDAEQRVINFDATGRQEFGDDWNEHCNAVASAVGKAGPVLLSALMETDDGHKAIPLLAADPDLAERLVTMSPYKAGQELAKLVAKAEASPKTERKPAATTTAAPRPIKPISGNAKSDGYRPDMTMDEYVAWQNKQAAS